MKPYKKYKDSGIQWIGEIPEHWIIKKLKYVAVNSPSNVDKKSKEDEHPVLLCNYVDVYKNEFITSSIDFMEATASDSQVKNFKLRKGDVLATKDSETIDDIAVPAYVKENFDNVICGYHLTHIKPIEKKLIGSFLFRLLETTNYRQYFSTLARGVTRYGLPTSAFSEMPTVLPTNEEQTLISNYLDVKASEIDQNIADKEQLINLYEEEKKALINEAVTKGINPKAKLKPSGIDWLGHIPEHWEIKKLKYLLKNTKGALKPGPFGSDLKTTDYQIEGNYKVYTQRNVLDNDFSKGDDYLLDEKFEALHVFEISPNDILVTTRGSIGKAAIFPANMQRGIIHPCLIKMQIDNKKVLNEWLINYFNESTYFEENVHLESNSTIIDVIYGYTLNNIIIPTPPTIKEQEEILKYLNSVVSIINDKINLAKQEIELLKEYRQALIFEAVTGKIDVTNN